MLVKNCRRPYRKAALFASWVLPLTIAAGAEALEADINNHYSRLTVTTHPGSELQLEIVNTPLARVLTGLARQLNIPIHYSVLPKKLVTATCLGSTLQQVLKCVLANKADLVMRYAQDDASNNEIAEVWIMGSSLAELDYPGNQCAETSASDYAEPAQHQDSQARESEDERANALLALAKSANPEERASAIEAVLADGVTVNSELRTVLETALRDQDAQVRAQAVSTLARLDEGSAPTPMLQKALTDESVDVRLMAVDAIDNDTALLNQALTDADETVRSLATAKLAALQN